MGFNLFEFESVDSTNEKAKSMVNTIPCPFVLSSNTQTKGKGQRHKIFHSPKDKGIYMSVVVDYPLSIKKVQTLNLNIGQLIAQTLNQLYQINLHSVYPNDVYYKDKKLAGILTEGIYNPSLNLYDAVIVGVGVNLYKDDDKPESIKSLAISLSEITNQKINKHELLTLLSDIIIQYLKEKAYEN